MRIVITLRRDARGRTLGVVPDGDPRARLESWQLYEVDRQNDPKMLAKLAGEIRAAILDVQAAVEDWMPIRERVRAISAGLGAKARLMISSCPGWTAILPA